MDIEKLEQAVESVGCTLYRSLLAGVLTSCCIMLPDSFPWYGDDFCGRRKNSRIVARVVIHSKIHSYCDKWKVWGTPVINICQNEPLGIEMQENDSGEALLLKNFDYEQIATWLQSKIGEVSEKAKECRKLMIAYQSKEYEA